MSFLSNLVGGSATKPIEAIGNTFDKLFTSDEERAQAEIILTKIAQKPHILQAEINKIEAGHRSVFVAGWRPFIGWICGIGLLNGFILNPYMEVLFKVSIPIPMEHMMTLVISLLGMGTLRTVEKLQGKAR